MNVLVIGCGLVGSNLARSLRAAGHTVTGTTTTPAKVEGLRTICDEVLVLRGSDRDAVHAAVADADAVAVCAGPSAQRSMTPEDRAQHYQEVLVDTARNVASAPGDAHLVVLSSNAVYGSAADHLDQVTEDAPLSDSADPSPASFRALEDAYDLERTCIFRCPDIHGPEDLPIEQKVALAHEHLGGSVPFSADGRFYRMHVDEIARAVEFAIEQRLVGVHNLVGDDLPPTNQERFDAIAAEQGLSPLTYRGEIEGPAVRISNAKLHAAGFAPVGG